MIAVDYDHRINKLEQDVSTLAERLAGIAEAVIVSRISLDKRMDAINEFRAQMGDQQRTLATRDNLDSFSREYRSAHEALSNLVNVNSARLSNLEGRMLAYGGVVGIISLAIAAISHFWR